MAARRLELGLSWDRLAKKAGITATALRAIRRGKNRGRDTTWYNLNQALQWAPGTLEAVFDGRIEAAQARPAERMPADDDTPLTRGEFRLYITMSQDPDADLSDSALNKLRALGIDPDRWRRERGSR